MPPPPDQPALPPGQPPAGPGGKLSDTMDRMLRPQGLFQNRPPAPGDWQQPYQNQPPQNQPAPNQPAPNQPPPNQPPPGQPPQGGQYPPPPGAFPQAWAPAATGTMPAAPALPAAPGQPGAGYPAGGQFPPGSPQAGGNPGSYGPGPGDTASYAGGQYPNGQYGQEQYPAGQYGPGVQYGGDQYGPDGMPLGGGPLAGGQGRSAGSGLLARLPVKRPLIPVTVAAALVVIVVAVIALSSRGGGSSPDTSAAGSSAAMPTTSASASSSTGTTALTQQQAATALAGLLKQSGTDHSDVNAAVTNVEGCKSLPASARTFTKAASNRSSLLSKLGQLPGRSALPAAMLANLTSGWQASATVDTDLAKWANAEAGHCKKNDTGNAAYTASLPFDNKATSGKTAFVKQWNGLARKYGLPAYQPSQI